MQEHYREGELKEQKEERQVWGRVQDGLVTENAGLLEPPRVQLVKSKAYTKTICFV